MVNKWTTNIGKRSNMLTMVALLVTVESIDAGKNGSGYGGDGR